MGRGHTSNSLRKAQRSMARGKINGKLLNAKGHRVTKRMTEERRQLNKDIALVDFPSTAPNHEEYARARVKYHSENPSRLHNEILQSKKTYHDIKNEMESLKEVYVLWDTEGLPEDHTLLRPFTPCDYHKKCKFPKFATPEEIIEHLEEKYAPLKVKKLEIRE